MNCPKCGNELKPNMKFCAKCGTPVAPAPQQPAEPVAPAQQKPAAPVPPNLLAPQQTPAKQKKKGSKKN